MIALTASSSLSKHLAVPVNVSISLRTALRLTTAPFSAMLPLRKARPPVGDSGSSTVCMMEGSSISDSAYSSASVLPLTVRTPPLIRP